MSEQKLPSEVSTKEKRYQFSLQILVQLIVFLLGYIASENFTKPTGLNGTLILLVIGILSFAVYLIPSSRVNPDRVDSIPSYWNTRIVALEELRLNFQLQKPGALKTLSLQIYLSSLEANYQAALFENRETLAKRFKELIDRYESELERISSNNRQD